MVLDASTLDSSEGALAAATHAIFIGGSEIAHKDGLKMGQPVHYWNKMPFAPGLYQASVGDKLSFLFNTEHTVWLMPSADASDSCDFTNAVELAGPTYGLPDWPELGSGDIKLGEANWPLASSPAPRGPARPTAVLLRSRPAQRARHGRRGGGVGGRRQLRRDHQQDGMVVWRAIDQPVRGDRDGAGRALLCVRLGRDAVGPAADWHALRGAYEGDGQRVRRGGHAQPAAAVAAAAAAGAAARTAAAAAASAAVAAAVAAEPAAAAARPPPLPPFSPGEKQGYTWGPFTWVAVIVGPLFAVACMTVFVYQIGAGNDWCRREKKEKDAPKPDEIDAPEREVHL